MITNLRENFNKSISDEKYQKVLSYFDEKYQAKVGFRIAETPVFIPRDLGEKLVDVSNHIIDLIVAPDFQEKTQHLVPDEFYVPNETTYPHFLSLDYAVSKDTAGNIEPQLIEMQGFPSLFMFLDALGDAYRNAYEIDKTCSHLLGGIDKKDYHAKLKDIILGGHSIKHVVLVDYQPHLQKTSIDFDLTDKVLGIKTVDYEDIIKEGKQLFYVEGGQKIQIKRIYNRLIFDELVKDPAILQKLDIREELEVEWVSHPNWFFRVSKSLLPFIDHPYAPSSFILDRNNCPSDLENYVLKPLHSFAGQGVIIDVTQADVDAVEDPDNYILQKKITYEPVVETPEGPIKCEIRLLYAWDPKAGRPTLLTNLTRLSQGMIGVSQNKSAAWSGGSVGFFEKMD